MKIQIVGELEFRILNKRGELERLFKGPFESLVNNFVRFNYKWWANTATNLIDTGGTARALSAVATFRLNALEGDNLFGLLLGTGTNPVDISDYNLQTKIAHGSGVGQLYHQACVVNAPVIVGSESYIEISRNFNNNSGSTITVQEAALIVSFTSPAYYFLIARDLTGAIDVLTTKTLAALYTFKVTV